MICFEGVHKRYGAVPVLVDVSLRVAPATMCVLCGPSGAGKSTLLSAVNGLEPVDRGEIWVDGVRLRDPRVDLRALRRRIGVVYQGFNLFPHLTAERNIRLGLEKGLGVGRAEAVRRAHTYLEHVGLLDRRDAYPSELSGGQQQRVAIARCLAMRPRILLLDEPTSALDVDNAREVVETIRSLASAGITIMLATHQVSMFADLADYFVCLEGGRVVEHGPRAAVLTAGCESKLGAWLGKIHALNGRPAAAVDGAARLVG